MKFKKSKLKSGLTIVTASLSNTKTVTVLVMVKAGSKYEIKSQSGISHFLEHMFFKGTISRPNTLAIASELDSIGGEYNAFTSKEITGYYAKADSKHLPLLLEIISDIFLNSKLDSEEIEREKLVILEEMKMYQDTPIKYIDDVLEELLYGNQPAGWKIIGEPETVMSISQSKLLGYLKRQYVAKNTLVLIAGDSKAVNNELYSAKAMASGQLTINNYFDSIFQNQPQSKKKVQQSQSDPQLKIHFKKTDQTHLALAVRAFDVHHSDIYALKILSIILGGNMSSRLFINIREQLGLCYYISAFPQVYTDSGYLQIRAGVDNKKVFEAVQAILSELRHLKKEGVKTQELKKAKDYVKGKLHLNLETSSEIAFWLAEQEMVRGKILKPKQILKKIDSVKLSDLARVGRNVLQNRKMNLALIGPERRAEKLKGLLTI